MVETKLKKVALKTEVSVRRNFDFETVNKNTSLCMTEICEE
jgi:hypothetical protein